MTNLTRQLKRMSDSFIPVAAMGVFMISSMSLLSSATENSSQFGRMHLVLVVINVIGLIVLVGLIGVNIIELFSQYRRKVVGSRLTARLVVIFVILSVAPVSLVYYYSLGFLKHGIDSWFDVRMERAMDDALELSRTSLDMRMRDLLRRTRGMSDEIMGIPDALVLISLNELRNKSGATELTLLTRTGQVILSSSDDTSEIIPNKPDDSILVQVKDNESFVGLAPVSDLGLQIRVAVRVDSLDATREPRVLYALFPIPERINDLANDVESAYGQYKKLVYLRGPLKNSFILTLSLVLLVSMLTAVWAAFFSAQRLMAPIRILSMGTKAVAAGDYDKPLTAANNDELGALVNSFSDMVERLAVARDEASHSQELVDRERAYLRVLLGRLSSGVITLDHQLYLRVFNASASQILELDMDKVIGKPIEFIEQEAPHLEDFVELLSTHLTGMESEWREQVSFRRKAGNKVLMCQGAPLPGVKGIDDGYVVVFDDVTNLVKAQREAAWGEVARRLAHEIKNPLTPIQLSAERLRRRYLQTLSKEDAELLDRSTHTIIQQVQAMQDMVRAFSEYARSPKLELQALDLEVLVNEVLDLYRGDESGAEVSVQLEEGLLPQVEADPGRIRQLLHNLIKNAVEATANQTQPQVTVHIASLTQAAKPMIELRISDNGVGIPDDAFGKLFEPYTSSKPKGGGIGLAVVKRIVEEHSGSVFAENNPQGGASVIVRLPALATISAARDAQSHS